MPLDETKAQSFFDRFTRQNLKNEWTFIPGSRWFDDEYFPAEWEIHILLNSERLDTDSQE